jgi:hypothetical protein
VSCWSEFATLSIRSPLTVSSARALSLSFRLRDDLSSHAADDERRRFGFPEISTTFVSDESRAYAQLLSAILDSISVVDARKRPTIAGFVL